jgi:hypothetical protein
VVEDPGIPIGLLVHRFLESKRLPATNERRKFAFWVINGAIQEERIRDEKVTSGLITISRRLRPYKVEPQCVCTDSIHSRTGRCPDDMDGERRLCPRRNTAPERDAS